MTAESGRAMAERPHITQRGVARSASKVVNS